MTAKEKNINVQLDKENFEHIFREFFPSLVLFAMKFVPDQDTAKEVVHNVFLNLWEKRETVDSSKTFKSYLFTSVHNRCLNHIRDQKKFDKSDNLFENLENQGFAEANDLLEEQELEGRIYEALNSLPEKCREVFTLSRFEEMKYGEIAEKLNISVKTVEAQMSKALKILREKLIDYLTIIIWFIFTHLN